MGMLINRRKNARQGGTPDPVTGRNQKVFKEIKEEAPKKEGKKRGRKPKTEKAVNIEPDKETVKIKDISE